MKCLYIFHKEYTSEERYSILASNEKVLMNILKAVNKTEYQKSISLKHIKEYNMI